MEYLIYIVAGGVFWVGAVGHVLMRCRARPHRDTWNIKYGMYLDPVGTVWLDRDCQHADRQRLLDAPQNIMTRLM